MSDSLSVRGQVELFDTSRHAIKARGCSMYWHDRMFALRRLHALGLRLERPEAAAAGLPGCAETLYTN